jgi:hypothetical protein
MEACMNIITEVDFENLGKIVGIFFVACGKLLFRGCSFDEGEHNPRFINYPESHAGAWERAYRAIYGFDEEYYPRGRLAYDKRTNFLMIYADPCIKDVALKLALAYKDGPRRIADNTGYRCHLCREDTV